MGKLLFVLFTVVPLAELWLMVQLGQRLGVALTIGLLLLSALVGSALARHQGTRVLRGWQNAMREGRVPEEGLLGGLLVFAGAVLLITPGVLTDVLGLALLVPPSRRLIAHALHRHFERQVRAGRVRMMHFGGGGGGFTPPSPGPRPQGVRRGETDAEYTDG